MTSTQLLRPHILPIDTDLHAAVSSGAFASAADPYPVYRRLQRDYPVLELFDAVSVFPLRRRRRRPPTPPGERGRP